MARRKKAKEPKTIKTTAAEFQQAVREANGASLRARNASSSKSVAVTDFCTRSGFSKKSFGLILQLEAMESTKRDETVRQILMGYELMGWGDQGDMFDDVGRRVRDAAQAADAEAKARKGQPKGTEGLPLDEAAKRFGANAHKAPKPTKAKTDPATAATASKYVDEQAKRLGSTDAPTVVFPDPPAAHRSETVA